MTKWIPISLAIVMMTTFASGDTYAQFLPQYADLHTETNAMLVQQVSRAGGDTAGHRFTWYADGSSYLADASLILGTSADDMSWQIYQGRPGSGPTPTNPYGYLYALSDITYDTTSSGSYRHAFGIGCNRDSTIAFTIDWYGPKHPDSAEFYLAVFDIYKGPNDPTGTVSNLTVAFAADWDIPTDSAGNFANTGGYDEDLQMVYQQGAWTAPSTNQYAGICARMSDNTPIVGGFIWESSVSVNPSNSYEHDSLWNRLQGCAGYSTTGSTVDLNSVLVVGKGVSIIPGTHYKFCIIFLGQPKAGGSLAGLQAAVAKAKKFICAHVPEYCMEDVCNCGDADMNGFISISDAVALISYVFNGTPVPWDCFGGSYGDFDGNGWVSISDAVACIGFVFNGYPCPHCQGMDCWTTK
jgi:hypothetical protein